MHTYGKHQHGHHCAPDTHVNAFVDLQGIPYLLAEYLDRRDFRQIDRSFIRSQIFIDQREAMRAVVDISVDDIGLRADGYPNVIGNNSKQKSLLNMAANMAEQLNHQFDVLRRGIIMRVNYQLENQRTGSVMRSMTEDLCIQDRMYFIDINPRDINDNAIIVNFSNSMVSTINEFTHGRDPMVLRITSVQMFYECLRRDPGIARIAQAAGPYAQRRELDYYNYHQQMQNHHIFAENGCHYEGYAAEPMERIAPPTWSMFSRYYHFDADGHDVRLHLQEITDPNIMCVLVPCGTIQVNRAFLINPGHRIIFKFSVWKNDVTVVTDALGLAEAIRTPYISCYERIPAPPPVYPAMEYYESKHHRDPYPPQYYDRPNPSVAGSYDQEIMKALNQNRVVNERQNKAISQLAEVVNGLREVIGTQHEGVELPDAVTAIKEDRPVPPPPHRHDPVKDKLKELKKLLKDLQDQSGADECDHTEIDEQIQAIQKELEDIRTNGTDEAVADKLRDLESTLLLIQEKLNQECDHEHPAKISDDKVGQLIDKIQSA